MKAGTSFLLLCLIAFGRADPIDDFVKAELIRTKSPSIAFGIIKDGKLVKHEVYGKANLESTSMPKRAIDMKSDP